MTRAEHYDAIYRSRLAAGHSGWNDRATVAEILGWLDELLAVAAVPPGLLLELGCGTGDLSLPLAERGHRVVGVDVSARAIDAARRRPVRGQAEFHVCDAGRALPARDADVVVDGLLLHCVTAAADRLAVLRLARRALAAHGALLVMTMCGDPRWLPPGAEFDHASRSLLTGGVARCHYAPPERLPGLFAAAGLCVEFSRVAPPLAGTDQDMYLAVLRGEPGAGGESDG